VKTLGSCVTTERVFCVFRIDCSIRNFVCNRDLSDCHPSCVRFLIHSLTLFYCPPLRCLEESFVELLAERHKAVTKSVCQWKYCSVAVDPVKEYESNVRAYKRKTTKFAMTLRNCYDYRNCLNLNIIHEVIL